MIYSTNDGPPEKPVQPPVVGSPPQTHYYQQSMPPVVQQQYPNVPPGAVPVQGGGYQIPRRQQYSPYGYPMMQQQVVVQSPRRGTNHGLHLILTLITGGLWLPVWLIVWACNGR